MNEPNKLPLVKQSMRMLLGKLRPDDRVAIVTYAGHSGLALPSTPVAKSREIFEALDELAASGSTNGAMGIQLAYDVAKTNFVSGGINRVILCTDGDFNIGVTSQGDLVRLVQDKAGSGVFLTVLGFGMGNLKDSTLELLADKGNGNYGYIDTPKEAEKLLVDQVSGTLVTIAKDVKIQVEFNPEKVESYRLIGYENRLLKKEDFNNDKVDAGEIGAGHTVTALYEIVPVGAEKGRAESGPAVDELRYQRKMQSRAAVATFETPEPASNELLTVKVRYKKPDGFISHRLDFPLTDAGKRFAEASADFRFAAAVAEFGMILRDSPHKGSGTIGDVVAWAAAASANAADDPGSYRSDFIGLARKAQALMR
jgi:Ca-activated chloride channel family protein